MMLTEKARRMVQECVDTGLYGTTVDEAAVRLICERLLQLRNEGFLPRTESANVQKCPDCGSHKLSDLSGMGSTEKEYQCQDCERKFAL